MTWNRRQFVNASVLGLLGSLGHPSSSFGLGLSQSTRRITRSSGEFGFRRRVESIDWYCELRGRGPTIVLIPSGEGDCGSFDKVAALLSREFTVLTFDMPGFSRSSDPPEFDNYSMSRAAREVAGLVRALGIAPATFYGCSSGGMVALWLAIDHSDVVRNVAVHEVAGLPLTQSATGAVAARLTAGSDEEIVRACKDLFRNQLNENGEAWDAMGDEFHKRLERNYVTWVRRYVGRLGRTPTPDQLRARPVAWTVGALTPVGSVFGNVALAHAAGLQIGLLTCRHFPQVSIPEVLAGHIAKVARS
jgi:pimeloyl-ACP methyl ester carboxylesterase